MNISNNLKAYLEEKKRINNLLVIPIYRKFCKKNKIDSQLALEKLSFHKKSLNLFNKTKRKYDFFDNSVVSWYFIDWGGDFSYQKYSVKEFIELMEKNEIEFNTRKEIFRLALIMTFFLTAIFFISILLNLGFFISFLLLTSVLGGEFIAEKIMSRRIKKEKEEMEEKIQILKMEIKNNLREDGSQLPINNITGS